MAFVARSDSDFDEPPSLISIYKCNKEVKNKMLTYSIHVSVAPESHDGHMAHYWAVQAIDQNQNNYTIAHGFHRTIGGAASDAAHASRVVQ